MSEEVNTAELLELKYEDAVEDYDDQVVKMTYELFIKKLYSELKEKVPKAKKENNYQDLRVCFHNFKTTSRYLGAENFSELCNKLQICCKEGHEDIEKFNKLYPVFISNFHKFYLICKEKYYEIANIEADDSEEDTSIEESSSENSKAKNKEKDKTPKLKSKFSLKNELDYPKKRFSSPRRGSYIAGTQSSLVNLISVEFSNEEKLIIPFHILTLSHTQFEVEKVVLNYINNFCNNKTFLGNLKNSILNKENEATAQFLNQIKEALQFILTDKFKLYMTQCMNLLSKGYNSKNEIEIMNKVDELNKEMNEMYEANFNLNFKRKKGKGASLRYIEEIKNSSLVSVPESSSSFCTSATSSDNSAMYNYVEILRELNSFEVLIKNSLKSGYLSELINVMIIYKDFVARFKYDQIEKNIEECIEILKKSSSIRDCGFNYDFFERDLNLIRADIEELASRTPIEVYEDNFENNTILKILKPGNYNSLFSLNLSNINEDEIEEKEQSFRNTLKEKSKKVSFSKKDSFEEEEDFFNIPFQESNGCKIM